MRKKYVKYSREVNRGLQINMIEHIAKFSPQEEFEIFFTKEDLILLGDPQTDPLVIKLKIVNSKVLWVFVDTGSSEDILFLVAIRQLHIGGVYMAQVKTPLYGFKGDSIYTEGMIVLPTTFGETPTQANRIIEFLVVDKPSTYNAIIGRPTLNALRAVTSTYHLAMKILTAWECYAMTMSLKLVSLRLDISTIFMIDGMELPTQVNLILLGELDSRDETEKRLETVEEVVEISVDVTTPKRSSR